MSVDRGKREKLFFDVIYSLIYVIYVRISSRKIKRICLRTGEGVDMTLWENVENREKLFAV